MAFSDEMIRAMVKTGAYSDPAAEQHLADVLIERRKRIGERYLVSVNPIVDVALDASGTLTFENAAVQAGVAEAPPRGYSAAWARFDNATGNTTPIGTPTSSSAGRMSAPSGLPTSDGTFVRVQISAVDPPPKAWAQPVDVYFRRAGGGWKLVGLERMP
jgi:hypothetical protein